MPSRLPATTARTTETSPASSETRVPQMTRESTSRPTLSVPRRCTPFGRASVLPRFCASGSYGATSGAARATRIASSITAAPNGASRAPAARRKTFQRTAVKGAGLPRPGRRSARSDSGIDPAIEHVDHEIADDEAHRDQQHDALHQGVVARKDRVDHEATDARQREDVFGDDRAADQRAELQAEDGHDGNERVS